METTDNWLISQLRQFRAYPHLDRAYRLISAGKHGEAAQELKTYLQLEPRDKQSRVTYLNVLYRLKRYDAVLQEANALLLIQPKSANAYFYQGLGYEAQGRKSAALNAYMEAIAAPELEAQSRKFAGNAAVELALHLRQYGSALKALEAQETGRGDFSYLVRKGAALAGLERHEDAVAVYSQAIATATTAKEKRWVHETLFNLERQLGRNKAALGHAEAILTLFPGDPVWLRTKATIHYLEKDNAQVLSTMAALMSNGAAVDDHFFLGNVLFEERRYTEAIKEYSTVVSAPTVLPSDMVFHAQMGLGYAYAALDQTKDAHQAFQKAMEIQPAQAARQALNNVTRMLKLTKYHATGETNAGRPGAGNEGDGEGKDAKDSAQRELLRQISNSAQRKATRGKAKTAVRQTESHTSTPAPDPAAVATKQAYQNIAEQDDANAVAAFEQAVRAGADSEQVYLDMAFAYARSKQPEKARNAFLTALRFSQSGKNIMYVARSYVATGQPELALPYFKMVKQALVEFTPEEQRAILIELGHVQVSLRNYGAALEEWHETLKFGTDNELLINIAYAQEMAKHKTAALATLVQVDTRALSPDLKFRIYTQLARIHDQLNDSATARLYMMVLVEMDPSADRFYQLGLYELRHKEEASALQHLQQAVDIDPGNLVYLEQVAYLYKNRGEYAKAAELFERAIRQDPGRVRLFQDLAYTYKQLGDNDNAVAWFKKSIDYKLDEIQNAQTSRQRHALSREGGNGRKDSKPPQSQAIPQPDEARHGTAAPETPSTKFGNPGPIVLDSNVDLTVNLEGKVETAYMDAGLPVAGRLQQVSFNPDSLDEGARPAVKPGAVVQQLAQESRTADDAIGVGNAGQTLATADRDEEVDRMRREVRELTRRFQFNVYQSYRAKSESQTQAAVASSPTFFNSGVIPSQGGVEFIYQPPGIGYQDGKIFQLYSRALWSNQPNSLSIVGKSVQAGVGARYKPFKIQDMFFSLERLIKIGDQSQNDWLARVSYALTSGYEMRQNESSWNQTIFYGDLGRFFPNAGITALYSELRQGRSFNVQNKVVVTPHVLLAGRKQTPDPDKASYLEAGAGVAVKYAFNENRYEAERSSAEFLVQYRRGLNNQHVGSWVFTAALQF